jgi:hypothetical protein
VFEKKTQTAEIVPAGLFVIQHRIPLVDALFLGCKEVVGGIENFNLLNFVATSDGVHDIHPIGHMTENGVFAVKSSLSQYRPDYVDWLILQYRNDQQFLLRQKLMPRPKPKNPLDPWKPPYLPTLKTKAPELSQLEGV